MAAPLTIAILCAAAVYLRGYLSLKSESAIRIPSWRVTSFALGLICVWVAAASPVAEFDNRMLTAHMVQHLLLMTFAPPLIWLASPVPPLMLGLPAAARRLFQSALAKRLGHGLANPAFCWLSSAAVLVAWHTPLLFRLGMERPAWHLIEHLSFLATGLLFWWPVVQPWPALPRWPRWSMLLYLFAATLPCDVLAGMLVFSDRIAYPVYICLPHRSAVSVLDDQQCAGALMWTCVTVVFLVAGTVLSTQLLAPHTAHEETASL